jgi:Domain of unknown function (DUF397)
MTKSDQVTLTWRKSSASGGGDCIEVASAGDSVLIRDSKNVDGPVISVTSSEWAAFLICVRRSELDMRSARGT